MNNLTEIVNFMRNPKSYIMKYASNNTNPMLQNLINMANNNDVKGLEEFARNFYKGKGEDFDKIVSTFIGNLK